MELRSARRPLKAEIAGSNPAEDAGRFAPVVKRTSHHSAKVEVLVQLQAGVLDEEYLRSVLDARGSPKAEGQVRFLVGILVREIPV